MIEVLKDLQPVDVFKYFEKLSQIPRGSGNEKEVSDYLVSFAKENNLEYVQDSALNVVIRKKASQGYENSPSVVLQGHMDMVCEKNTDVEHDFTKDPLKLRIIDDRVYAILASDEYQHPAIELLVTTSEETGMDGAMELDPKNITGRTLINIDSEEEGTILVSCAGGVTAKVTIPVKFESVNENLVPYSIKIRGLKGGHSGMEIDKGRGNSNKLMGRVLMTIFSETDIRLSSLNGGSKHNAIPREADAVILVRSEDSVLIEKKIQECEETFKNELRTPDPDIRVEFEALQTLPSQMLSKESTKNIINYLYLIIDGVTSMSMDIKGLVESSLNLGVVTTYKDYV